MARTKVSVRPIHTYVWRVDLTELNGKERTLFGHVNLVR